MYAYLHGKPVVKGKDHLIIDVKDIGYRVFTSQTTLHRVTLDTSAVTLFTHLHVRENEMTLYGFDNQEELEVFEMLLNVSGIGPKVALNIISFIETPQFYAAIINQDIKTLSKAPGIGKKTASRLVLELREKINALKVSQETTHSENFYAAEHVTTPEMETIEALQSLGYDAQEARIAVLQAVKQAPSKNVQELLRYALKCLARI